MIQHIKTCFEKYGTFSGRANRSEFWFFYLFLIIAPLLVAILFAILGVPTQKTTVTINLFYLGTLVPFVSVAVRRMHDVNKSGWFYLIPFYNLYLSVKAGDKSENKYGKASK